MLLVIPSITIRNGLCEGRIRYPDQGAEQLLYSLPEDRARLLRKENAKALHLDFLDDEPWNSGTLEQIDRIRGAVDIPIQVSLSTIPEERSLLRQLLQSGIYRLFLPLGADDRYLQNCVQDFSCQKVVVSIPLMLATRALFERLHSDGLTRSSIPLFDNYLSSNMNELCQVAKLADDAHVRLSLHGRIRSYQELKAVSKMQPGFDSIILTETLEENLFPCEAIWREVEFDSAYELGTEANLWKNPLEGTVHV